jgi:hypothetical protein
MTVFEVFASARRAWAVFLAGLLLTTAAAVFVARTTGVFWAQVDVVFLGAVSENRPNPLSYTSKRLVDVASVVQRDVTGAADQTQVVSPGLNLIDTGVKDGWWVRLPNYGGQYTISYDRPALDVQVAAPTAEAASVRMARLLARINDDLDRRQDGAAVMAEHRVTTSVSPPPAVEIHYSQGPAKQGLLITVLVGLGLSLAAADWWDRRHPALRIRTRVPGPGRTGFLARHSRPVSGPGRATVHRVPAR